MSDKSLVSSNSNNPALQRQMALSRWDNEGGAGPDGPHNCAAPLVTGRATLVSTTKRSLVIRSPAMPNSMSPPCRFTTLPRVEIARDRSGPMTGS